MSGNSIPFGFQRLALVLISLFFFLLRSLLLVGKQYAKFIAYLAGFEYALPVLSLKGHEVEKDQPMAYLTGIDSP